MLYGRPFFSQRTPQFPFLISISVLGSCALRIAVLWLWSIDRLEHDKNFPWRTKTVRIRLICCCYNPLLSMEDAVSKERAVQSAQRCSTWHLTHIWMQIRQQLPLLSLKNTRKKIYSEMIRKWLEGYNDIMMCIISRGAILAGSHCSWPHCRRIEQNWIYFFILNSLQFKLWDVAMSECNKYEAHMTKKMERTMTRRCFYIDMLLYKLKVWGGLL